MGHDMENGGRVRGSYSVFFYYNSENDQKHDRSWVMRLE